MTPLGAANAAQKEMQAVHVSRSGGVAHQARKVRKGREVDLHGVVCDVTIGKGREVVEEGGLGEREMRKAVEAAEVGVGGPTGAIGGEGVGGE